MKDSSGGERQAQAAPDGLAPVWRVPHLRNRNFTGREGLLRDLRESLVSGHHAALTQAIHGLGGVGKTQLAVEYCYRHAAEYEAVWWVRAEEAVTRASDYAALAGALGLPERDAREQERAVEAVCRWLEHHGGWLLVFDNAPDPESVKPYLPHGMAGHVIITSRHRTWSEVAKAVAVPEWPEWEAIEFLTRRLPRAGPEDAADLAQELDYLPLALAQAAAYIEETGTTIPAYLELFRKRRKELLKRGKPGDYPETIATTWDISFRRLQEESPAGAALLNLCAFLAPDDIPLDMIAQGAEFLPSPLRKAAADPLALADAVAAARRHSLIESAEEALSVHRLVQAVVRDRLGAKATRRWAEAAVSIVGQAFPFDSDDVRTWADCARMLAHALTAADHAEALAVAPDATGCALNQAAGYLWGRGDLGQAKGCLARALRIAEGAYRPEHPTVATAFNNLGLVLQDLGDLKGARECFERALRIDEAAYGPEHPEVAADVNNLGLAVRAQGDLEGARECLERALRIGEAAYGPDHPQVAIYVNNLGNVLQAQGDLKGARECYERALRIDEAAYALDHPSVARDVNNLGLVLRDLGDLKGAREYLERALRIDEAALGPDHPNVATDVNNLGGVLRDLGDLKGARECLERAFAIFRQFLGEEHPRTKIAKRNLAALEAEAREAKGK